MSSSKSQAATAASRQYDTLSREAYGLGVPMLRARNEQLMPALRQSMQGELPAYMEKAFEGQRAGVTEGLMNRERQQIAAQDMEAKGAVKGGNIASTLNPAQMGAALADAMMGSRVQQGMATVNQANTLMQMGLGGAAQTGNQAVQSAGLNLQGISMLPDYNPTYAAVLGAANLAGTVYGAGKQKGWWGGGQQPNSNASVANAFASQPGMGGAGWGGGPGAPVQWGYQPFGYNATAVNPYLNMLGGGR